MDLKTIKQGRALTILLGAEDDEGLEDVKRRLNTDVSPEQLIHARDGLRLITDAIIESDGKKLDEVAAALGLMEPTARPTAPPETEQPATSNASHPAPAAAQSKELGGTAFLTAFELDEASIDGPTPFQEGAASVAPPRQAMPVHAESGATSMVDPSAVAKAISHLPIPSNLPMSVDDYASLVAHTEQGGPYAAGEARNARHLDHAIADETHRTRIDADFREHFVRNPGDGHKFTTSLARWRAWLQQQR